MKWPWTRRADEAWERAHQAEREQARLRDRWAAVDPAAAAAHMHKRLNGWNEDARTLIGDGGSR